MAWKLFSHNIELADWTPDDPEDFEVTLDFYAGPDVRDTSEGFTVRVCSPKWFFREHGDDIVSGENTIFMRRFDAAKLIRFIEDRCAQTEGETWNAIAAQLTRLGRWEYDYKVK